jgi:septal ring factor EnvC (AmiA/AmiB activator)
MEGDQLSGEKEGLWKRLAKWFGGVSIKAKLVVLSIIIFILGVIAVNSSNNEGLSKALEESKKKTEKKLKTIALYNGRIDGYETYISNVEDEIEEVTQKIEDIKAEEPEDSSLDDFFDKRVK